MIFEFFCQIKSGDVFFAYAGAGRFIAAARTREATLAMAELAVKEALSKGLLPAAG